MPCVKPFLGMMGSTSAVSADRLNAGMFMPIAPGQLHRAELRFQRIDGVTFEVRVANPRMAVIVAKAGSTIELDLIDPAGLFTEGGRDAPALLDALRGTAPWLTGVALPFGALGANTSPDDGKLSARVTSSLGGAIGYAGAALRVMFPDYTAHTYVVTLAQAEANQIIVTVQESGK